MRLLKASWVAYSFSQNCDKNCKISYALVFFNFLCRIAWYCFCGISVSTTTLCLKLCIEVASSVLFPKPQVWVELVSPIGTYESFPKMTYFRTVQHRELLQIATCHSFTFGVWNFYHINYSPCPIWNILWNFIWTFIARDIANVPKLPVLVF